MGHDSRLNKFFIKAGEPWFTAPKYFPRGLAVFWTLQFLWGWIVSAPAIIVVHRLGAIHTPFSWHDLLFLSSACFGLLWEIIADYQKDAFKSDKANEGKFCQVGVWSYSRQPNYFGEILFWYSIFGFCSFYFVENSEFASISSPLFTSLLLLFVSGIPLAEKKQVEQYGTNEDFQYYKANTSMLIPWFPAGKRPKSE